MNSQVQYFNWKDYDFDVIMKDSHRETIASVKEKAHLEKTKSVRYQTGLSGNCKSNKTQNYDSK